MVLCLFVCCCCLDSLILNILAGLELTEFLLPPLPRAEMKGVCHQPRCCDLLNEGNHVLPLLRSRLGLPTMLNIIGISCLSATKTLDDLAPV